MWDPMMTVVWGLAIFGVQTVIGVVAGVVYLGLTLVRDPEADLDPLGAGVTANGALLSAVTLASTLVSVGLIALFIVLRKGWPVRRYLALTPVAPGRLGLWLLALAGWIAAADLGSLLLGRPVVPEFVRQAIATAGSLPALWLAVVVAAPLGEELFFRGFLFAGLRRSRLGEGGTIVVTSLFWAALHVQYGAYEILSIFLLGLLLGAARWKTESIWPPLVMHALCNAFGLLEAGWTHG